MGIEHEDLYREYIIRHGVASGRSENSYVSRLNTVSRVMGREVSPEILHNNDDIQRIRKRLSDERFKPKAISDITAAMKKHIAMVAEHRLWPR